jgi:hypothetical protein
MREEIRAGLYLKCRYCRSILTKTGMGQDTLVKFPIIRFHQNSVSGSRIVE